jgi:hypothetical protein
MVIEPHSIFYQSRPHAPILFFASSAIRYNQQMHAHYRL